MTIPTPIAFICLQVPPAPLPHLLMLFPYLSHYFYLTPFPFICFSFYLFTGPTGATTSSADAISLSIPLLLFTPFPFICFSFYLPLPGPTGATTSSADAMKVLRGYYDAFNKHDILAAVAFLAIDVKVKFPDSKKNWSSAAGEYSH